MNVSIVIPAKDEASTLPPLLADLNLTIAELPDHTFEVIVVDDHSTDATAAVAAQGGAVVVANQRKGGKGHALITGFENARGEVIIMMDADLSHMPQDIPAFLARLKCGFGLVVGSRTFGGSEEYTVIRSLGNVGLSFVFRLLTGVTTSDVLNGYKAFRREVFTSFPYRSRQFEIEIELMTNTLRKGWRIGEIPSHERARAGGEAKSRVIQHGCRFLWAILRFSARYRWEQFIHKTNEKT